jgi:DNA topoisomerase-1
MSKIKRSVYKFTDGNLDFITQERVHNFPGFMICDLEGYSKTYRIKKESFLKEVDVLEIERTTVQEHSENRPVRFNEGSMIQELERLGIGRPSTYNAFGKKLVMRGYVKLDLKGRFFPTDLGIQVNG